MDLLNNHTPQNFPFLQLHRSDAGLIHHLNLNTDAPRKVTSNPPLTKEWQGPSPHSLGTPLSPPPRTGHKNLANPLKKSVWVAPIFLSGLLIGIIPDLGKAQTIKRVSVDSNGAQGLGASYDPVISGNGRFVIFGSGAPNLVPDDKTAFTDVFVHDRQTGQTTRESVNSNGEAGNGNAGGGFFQGLYDISDDGRLVVFDSLATNMDGAGIPGIFIRDRIAGITTRVSLKSNGDPGRGNSNLQAGFTNLRPTISGDGRFVAFSTGESDFVPNDTNGEIDVFVRDRQLNKTFRVSVASDGSEGLFPTALVSSWKPAISADGQHVAFCSSFMNLVPNDTNSTTDVFVHNLQTRQTTRVSVSSSGEEANSVSCGRGFGDSIAISGDGRFVTFSSEASNLVSDDTNLTQDIFVHDRQTGETTRVSVGSNGQEGKGGSTNPRLSGDGRFVVFESVADNLVQPEEPSVFSQIFLHDRQTGITTRVSNGLVGEAPSAHSGGQDISDDGQVVVFSNATILDLGDDNNASDVFVSGHDHITLTVRKEGSGEGFVSSNPLGIDCKNDCNEPFLPGRVILLTPTPASGSVFTGWSGGTCTGMGPCSVTLTDDTTVTATFDLLSSSQYLLQVTTVGIGTGTVTSTPNGITCGPDCTETYNENTLITLTATPDTGSTFAGWSGGGCSGTGTCEVSMTSDRSVTAMFQTQPVVPPNNPPQTPRDLNGDGRTDLLWRNTKTGSTAIWLLNGASIGSAGFPGGVPLAWQVAGIGDVNGDGKADVIWRHTTSATVAIWLMNGTTITSVGFPASVPTAWSLQAVGDLNGDDKADLVWRNSNDGNTAIWLMNGTKIAASGFLGKVPLAWQLAGAGDVNGDGKADLIWRNGTSHAVAIWVMNGLTMTSSGFPGNASPDLQIAGVGDVNGDGKADLVWRNTSTGDVEVWLLNGTTIGSTGSLDGLSSQWQIAQVGDADGDGKTDVIWYDTASGAVRCWLLNGLTIASEAFPGTASPDWIIAGRPVAPPLSITTASTLPAGTVNKSYSITLAKSGGTPSFSWTVFSGSLPPGLALNPSTGQISGTPTTAGKFLATIRVRDSGNPPQSAQALFSLTIDPPPSPPPTGGGGGTLTITGAPARVGGKFVAENLVAERKNDNGIDLGLVGWLEFDTSIPHAESLNLSFSYDTGVLSHIPGILFITSGTNEANAWSCSGQFIISGAPLLSGTCTGVTVNRSGGTVTFSNTVLEDLATGAPPITLNGTLTFPPF